VLVVVALSGVENLYGWHAALVLFCCMNKVGQNEVAVMDGVVRYECGCNHVVEHLVGAGVVGGFFDMGCGGIIAPVECKLLLALVGTRVVMKPNRRGPGSLACWCSRLVSSGCC